MCQNWATLRDSLVLQPLLLKKFWLCGQRNCVSGLPIKPTQAERSFSINAFIWFIYKSEQGCALAVEQAICSGWSLNSWKGESERRRNVAKSIFVILMGLICNRHPPACASGWVMVRAEFTAVQQGRQQESTPCSERKAGVLCISFPSLVCCIAEGVYFRGEKTARFQ